MTIILSFVKADYALQVSDRLLTLKKGNRYVPWDPIANKAVILRAGDGLVAMAYTGTAHIAGATTDGWIAEVLSGEDLGASRTKPKFGIAHGGTRPERFLAAHLTEVADRLNGAVRVGHMDRNLAIDFVGLRWRSTSAPAWPVFGRIAWDRGQGRYKMSMSKRRWGWESGRRYIFRASGRSEKKAQALLRSRLLSVDVGSQGQTANALIDVLRSLPPHDPTVGRDCLVTGIQRTSPHVHVRYEPYALRQLSVVFAGRN